AHRLGLTRAMPRHRPERERPRRATPHAGGAMRLEGRYARVRGGFGFVEIPGRARDVLIPEGEEDGALHGDRVAVELLRGDGRGRRAMGRIVAVVERSR